MHPKAQYATPEDRALAAKLAVREADWRIGPVVYQVIVDRFAPSASLDAKRHLYAAPRVLRTWDETPRRGVRNDAAGLWSHELDFWGGDLASLSGKLDYIKDLKVDVLYLNPIHQAFTNHKYDAQDYFKVSEEYGTRAEVGQLAKDVQGRGMRLVLDGVLNHMGRTSPMFQDALNNPNSQWRDWYFVGPQYKLGYRAWWDVANLPDVNWENPEVRKRLYGDRDSVIQGYLREGVDGWRLDVAYDIGFNYLADLTRAVHRAKPGSLVLGEVYQYPGQWLQAMDGILSTTFGFAAMDVARGTMTARQAGDIIERVVADSDYEQLLKCWILLENHDTPRLHSALPDQERRRIAQVLQFTMPGAVNLYYGIETGQTGTDDPMNRAPMRWDLANDRNPDFVWIKQLTDLRASARALRVGEFRRIDSERLLAFSRHTDRIEDFVMVVVNNTDEAVTETVAVRESKIVNGEHLVDVFTGARMRHAAGLMPLTVPARTAMVLRPQMRTERDYDAYKRVQ